MPCEIIKHKQAASCWWNFTTTRFTPNIRIFRVAKIDKFWLLKPDFNCPEYQPLHLTLKAAIQHYWQAHIPIDKFRKS